MPISTIILLYLKSDSNTCWFLENIGNTDEQNEKYKYL